LGNREEARRWFDRAVEWLEQNKDALQRKNQEAGEPHRFHQEAEAVLELNKP
jgi:hypothetical protein